MVRQLTPKSSLENLKREAKRWLRAIHAGDAEARSRFARSHPKAPAEPSLRDVQLALAREYGFDGWSDLKGRVERKDEAETPLQQLLLAAGEGRVADVARLLDNDPELLNQRGTLPGNTGVRTALHFGSGHKDVVKLLLERGANPNIRDEGDDAMPLHFVAERGDLEIVKLLIEYGADPVGDGTMHELNVLGWAICWDYVHHADVAKYLLAHGAKHTVHTAVALGDLDALREVLARSPSDVDKPMDRTNLRRRPLHLAVIKKQPDALRVLLDHGADINAHDARGLTALDQAALDGKSAIVELLLQHDAKLNLPAAIALNRVADAERLLREEPSALQRGGRWQNLIVHAAAHSSGQVIDALIRAGADVNAGADPDTAIDQTHNYTALHAAAWNGNDDAVRVLMRHGANVRARDSKYCATPAGWADYNKKPQTRDLILQGPIDIFDAIDFDRPELIADLLRSDAGALERPFGEYGNCDGAEWLPAKNITPLEFARLNKKDEAIRVLLAHGARAGSGR